MKYNVTSFLLATVFLTTACSKSGGSNSSSNISTSNSKQRFVSNDYLEDWQNILRNKSSIQTLETLASEVSSQNREAVLELLKDFSEEEIKEIFNDFKENELRLRNAYLYRDADWSNNQTFLNKTILINSDLVISNIDTPSDRILLSVTAKAKDKLLNEIIDTYSKRMAELSEELAPIFAAEILKKKPYLVSQIEQDIQDGNKDKAIKNLTTTIEGLQKFDEFFKGSDLNDKEQVLATLSLATAGAIAYKIHEQVKGTKTFKQVVKAVKKGQEISKTFKELKILAKSLNDYTIAMEKDSKVFTDASSSIAKDIGDVFQSVKEEGIKGIDAKKTFQFLYDKTLGGKKSQSKNIQDEFSIASKPWQINQNVNVMLDSASRMTNHFSSILDTTTIIASKLGIKLSPEISKLVDKANKVGETIGMAQKVIDGLASGGVLGAFQAFSSGPAAALLGGGGGFESKVMKEFGTINKKLDQIITLQKKMIELQISTMEMIQKLALMIDQYHQEEMAAIASLRNINVVTLEIAKAGMNSNISECEMIVNAHMNKKLGQVKFDRANIDAANAASLSESLFSDLGGFKGIHNFIRSNHDFAFQYCQQGIAKTFGQMSTVDKPIFSIYMTTDENDLKKFYEKNYLPLYKVIKNKAKERSTLSMALHAPMERISDLPLKYIYTNNNVSAWNRIDYDLENLISPIALERYASQLLIFHPYIEMDRSEWSQSIENVFKRYVEIVSDIEDRSRGQALLFNALKITQTAIAQEAILAGEPMLDDISQADSLKAIFKDNSPCSTKTEAQACAMRTNALLMKNLFLYSFHNNAAKYGHRLEEYEWAYKEKDIKGIERIVFKNTIQGKIRLNKGSLEMVTISNDLEEYKFDLPTPKEMQEGFVQYSENMGRLIKLQDKLVDALIKTTPLDNSRSKEKIGIYILSKSIKGK